MDQFKLAVGSMVILIVLLTIATIVTLIKQWSGEPPQVYKKMMERQQPGMSVIRSRDS